MTYESGWVPLGIFNTMICQLPPRARSPSRSFRALTKFRNTRGVIPVQDLVLKFQKRFICCL
eukprot:9267525-Karenia_brevis.AAC.1